MESTVSTNASANNQPNGVNGNEVYEKDLCLTCKGLNLSAERFIIEDDSSMQVKKVRNSYLAKSDPRRISDFSLKSRSRKHLLGSLGQILEKSKRRCPFCSLVIKSVTEPGLDAWEDYDAVSAATCSIIWEVDGREAASGSGRARARTRRIHLCWNESRLKDSYLIFVAPEKYSRPNSDAQWVCGNEALFLGRDIDPAECNQALIKSWLDLCCSSHRGPCTDMGESSEKFDEMVKQSYFGVIDVLNMQLTSLPYDLQQDQRFEEPKMVPYVGDRVPWVHSGRPYQPQQVKRAPFVALSYVWKRGKAPYTTKLSNIMLYRRPGGLGKIIMKLPRVIQDAIELVRRLGMRYIWIDSLCIVQDSPRSWNLNARNMDLIYGNAILTICAADGSDSSTGLRAMYPKPEDYCQHKEECVPGVTLMASRHPEMGIEASTWNTRAWTFQERLLSKRCLIFTEGRVYFQCRSTGMSEDIFADRQGAGWSLDLINAPLRMLLELSSRAVKVYMNCVSLYTSRILSNPQDILAAFNGISNFMEQTLQAPFVFGLPTSHFDLALLWESQGALGRRIPVVFPSWSWCGWIGPNGATVEYKAKMVEGCFTNLHEWLTRHTWICWYVRDGRGNLRPLWDAKKSRADKTTHERWRGYKSRPQKQRKPDRDKLWYKSQKVVNRNRRGSAGTSDSQDSHRTRRTRRREGYDNGDKDKSYDRVVHEVESELQSDAQSNSDNDIEVYGDYDRIFPSDDDIEVYGDYGRILPSDVSRQNQKNFHLTLPENPYRVVMADFNSEPDKEFPDQPILQFWTWQTTLHILPFESEVSEMKPGTGLRRYDIADDIGDWCGSIVLDEQQIKDAESSQHEFIAISDANSFSAEECEIWTYYIPQEREQSEWDLYYVLLIKLVDRKWERVGLGKASSTCLFRSWSAAHGTKTLIAISRNGLTSLEAHKTYNLISVSPSSSLQVIQADACDRAAMSTTLRNMRKSHPIKGVINMAMLLGDAALADMETWQWGLALRLKVDSSRMLREETLNAELEFFVLFSSIASVLGNGNRAGYNVGKTFLKALVAWMREMGRTAVTVALGAKVMCHTADIGILHALRTPNVHSAFTRSGLAPLLAPDFGKFIETAIVESSERFWRGKE